MAAPKGNKFAGSRKGVPNKKNTPEVKDLRSMVVSRITPKLLDRIEKENPGEILRNAVKLEAIFNPQKHELKHELGATAVKLVERLNKAIERTSTKT